VRTLRATGGRGLGRDLALALRIAGMLAVYLTAGARLRRAYRRCEARGEVLRVDTALPASSGSVGARRSR
jgi:hypothetical protein